MKGLWPSLLLLSMVILFQNCGAFKGVPSVGVQSAPTDSDTTSSSPLCIADECPPGFVENSQMLQDGSVLTQITADPAKDLKGFSFLSGISVATNGDLLLASEISGAFRIYDSNFTLIKSLKLAQPKDDYCLGCPQSIAPLDDRHLILNMATNKIGIYDRETSEFAEVTIPTKATPAPVSADAKPIPLLDYNSRMVSSGNGAAYFLSPNDLFMFQQSTQLFVNLATDLGLSRRTSLALGGNSDLYIFDFTTKKTLHYSLDGMKLGALTLSDLPPNISRGELGFDPVHSAFVLAYGSAPVDGITTCGVQILGSTGETIHSRSFADVLIEKSGQHFCADHVLVQKDGTVLLWSEHQVLKLKSGFWL